MTRLTNLTHVSGDIDHIIEEIFLNSRDLTVFLRENEETGLICFVINRSKKSGRKPLCTSDFIYDENSKAIIAVQGALEAIRIRALQNGFSDDEKGLTPDLIKWICDELHRCGVAITE